MTEPMPSPLSEPLLIPRSDEARDALVRQIQESPGHEDVRKETGAEIVHDEDGTWTAVVKDRGKFGRAAHLLNGVRKVEIEKGVRNRETTEQAQLINRKTGRALEVPSHLAERVAKKTGMVERPRWRRPKYQSIDHQDGSRTRIWYHPDGSQTREFTSKAER